MKKLSFFLVFTTACTVFGFNPEQSNVIAAMREAISNNTIVRPTANNPVSISAKMIVLDNDQKFFETLRENLKNQGILLNRNGKCKSFFSDGFDLIKYNIRSKKEEKKCFGRSLKFWQVRLGDVHYVYVERFEGLEMQFAVGPTKNSNPIDKKIVLRKQRERFQSRLLNVAKTVPSSDVTLYKNIIWPSEMNETLFEVILSERDPALFKSFLSDQDFALLATDKDHYGNPLLHRLVHMALDEKDAAMLEVLLQANLIPINGVDAHGRTALHWAVDEGKIDIVNLLLIYGSNVNQLDANNFTALNLAIINNRVEIQHLLQTFAGNIRKFFVATTTVSIEAMKIYDFLP